MTPFKSFQILCVSSHLCPCHRKIKTYEKVWCAAPLLPTSPSCPLPCPLPQGNLPPASSIPFVLFSLMLPLVISHQKTFCISSHFPWPLASLLSTNWNTPADPSPSLAQQDQWGHVAYLDSSQKIVGKPDLRPWLHRNICCLFWFYYEDVTRPMPRKEKWSKILELSFSSHWVSQEQFPRIQDSHNGDGLRTIRMVASSQKPLSFILTRCGHPLPPLGTSIH